MTVEAAEAALDAAAAAGDAPLVIVETALALALLDQVAAGGAAPDLGRCRTAVEAIEAAVAAAEARGDGPLAALGVGISEELGYRGDTDTYDDLANADLIRVLERRRGLPVALGILYIHAARARGHPAAGLNVPGHFLIGVEVAGRRRALDPFHGGDPVDTGQLQALLNRVSPGVVASPSALATVTDRAVLLRLQNNIKLRRLQAGDTAGGLAVLARMRRMAPEAPDLVREEAGLMAATGAMRAASAALRDWLAAGYGSDDVRRALEAQLAGIGSRLN